MKRVLNVVISIMIGVIFFNNSVEAKRGCCSWHGGVSGCSSSGRIICNDGTYSPSCTCTPPKVYGCTDYNAINYNSNANTENGSCRYQREKEDIIVLDYEIEIQNPNHIENGKHKIIQTGKKGQKSIRYRVTTDVNGNELSKEMISEVVIVEPINEIVLVEEIVTQTLTNTDQNVVKLDNSNLSSESSENVIIFILCLCLIFIWNKLKIRKLKQQIPFLYCVESLENKVVRYICYFLYIMLIFPIIIDFIFICFKIGKTER